MMKGEWTTFSQLGRALWQEPERSYQHSVETLSAVSLQENLTQSNMIEKAVQGMIAKANRESVALRKTAIQHPFYRLTPEERVLLVGLHFGSWSYARLGRILNATENEVMVMAWRARLNLASFIPAQSGEKPLMHPPGTQGARCPEYDPLAPWTQKFLDEEFPKRERHFLQNHLMACSRCLTSLNRARDLYYRIEKLIPVSSDAAEIDDDTARFEEVFRAGYRLSHPLELTLLESLTVFFARTEVRVLLLAGCALFLVGLLR